MQGILRPVMKPFANLVSGSKIDFLNEDWKVTGIIIVKQIFICFKNFDSVNLESKRRIRSLKIHRLKQAWIA